MIRLSLFEPESSKHRIKLLKHLVTLSFCRAPESLERHNSLQRVAAVNVSCFRQLLRCGTLAEALCYTGVGDDDNDNDEAEDEDRL